MAKQAFSSDRDVLPEETSAAGPVKVGCLALLAYKIGCLVLIAMLVGTVVLMARLGAF